jgi:predicted transcriptional regulator
MEQVQYPEDYIGDKKVSDIDWRKFKDSDDDLDDVIDKPASKELIAELGVNPDELFKEDD